MPCSAQKIEATLELTSLRGSSHSSFTIILQPARRRLQPARKRLNPARKSLQPARKRLQSARKRLQPSKKKLQPARKPFQPAGKNSGGGTQDAHCAS